MQALTSIADLPGISPALGVRDGVELHHERTIEIKRHVASVMLHAQIRRQEIEAKGILFLIHLFKQTTAKLNPLHRADGTFEKRLLHSLTEVFTRLRYPPKAFLASLVHR
jgi:hypothetical protein